MENKISDIFIDTNFEKFDFEEYVDLRKHFSKNGQNRPDEYFANLA